MYSYSNLGINILSITLPITPKITIILRNKIMNLFFV